MSDGQFLLVFGLVVGAFPMGIGILLVRWMRRATPTRWPRLLRWLFWFIKWNLVAMGAAACVGLAVDEIREKRVGLGTGVVTAVTFGTIKALLTVAARLRQHPRGPESSPPL